MAIFSGAGGMIDVEPTWPAGSPEARLGVNPRTGMAVIAIDRASIPPDLLAYVDEFDARLSLEQRAMARQRRVDAEKAAEVAACQTAAETLQTTKEVPAGWLVVRHADTAAGCSLGHDLDGGFRLIRGSDVETIAAFGWRPAAWPA